MRPQFHKSLSVGEILTLKSLTSLDNCRAMFMFWRQGMQYPPYKDHLSVTETLPRTLQMTYGKVNWHTVNCKATLSLILTYKQQEKS